MCGCHIPLGFCVFLGNDVYFRVIFSRKHGAFVIRMKRGVRDKKLILGDDLT